MGFAAAFVNECNDRHGEGLTARIWVRCTTGAGSNQLVELTSGEKIISLTPLERRRERSPGIMQALQWSATLTNKTGKFHKHGPAFFTTDSTLIGMPCAIEIGFPDANLWERFDQGEIRDWRVKSDGTCTIYCAGLLFDIVNKSISRPLVMDQRGPWASPITPVKVSATSKEYDNANNPPGTTVPNYWERFILRFATATTYNVIRENGTTQSGGPFTITSGTVSVKSYRGAQPIAATVPSAGWDQGANAYATGDEFELTVCPSNINDDPVGTLITLLIWAFSDDNGETRKNVITDASENIRYDTSHWTAVSTDFTTVDVRGWFRKGTRYADLVQGLLRIMNASLWQAPGGQIGIYHVEPNSHGTTTKEISGAPDAPNPVVIEAERREDDRETTRQVIYKYRALNFPASNHGQEDFMTEARVTATSGAVSDLDESPPTYELLWACDSNEVEAAANRHLNRFVEPMPTYYVRGTLTDILEVELGDAITVSEPGLAATNRKGVVTAITLDVLANETVLEFIEDPVVTSEYWILGTSVLGTDTIIF